MNKQQLTAYQNPCFEAEETSNPKFKNYGRIFHLNLSVILTVNIGLE